MDFVISSSFLLPTLCQHKFKLHLTLTDTDNSNCWLLFSTTTSKTPHQTAQEVFLSRCTLQTARPRLPSSEVKKL